MKLNLFVSWLGYGLILVAVISLGMFLVAAGSGYGGWAVIAGSVGVVAAATAMATVGGAAYHDRKLHRETPHLF